MSHAKPVGPTIGLLLAAGRGSRFDPSAVRDKLQAVVDGVPAVVRSARNLVQATGIDQVMAVVRPGVRGEQVTALLADCVAAMTVCPDAAEGMGHSLAWGVAQAMQRFAPERLVVALGDMPFVQPATIARLLRSANGSQTIVAPRYRNQRGHPVVFGRDHFDDLMQTRGDRGAGPLLAAVAIEMIDVDDAGVLQDIDTPADLPGGPARGA